MQWTYKHFACISGINGTSCTFLCRICWSAKNTGRRPTCNCPSHHPIILIPVEINLGHCKTLMIRPACVLPFSVSAIRNGILMCWKDYLVIVSDLSCAGWGKPSPNSRPLQWTRASRFPFFCCLSRVSGEGDRPLHKELQHSHLQPLVWCWPLICSTPVRLSKRTHFQWWL